MAGKSRRRSLQMGRTGLNFSIFIIICYYFYCCCDWTEGWAKHISMFLLVSPFTGLVHRRTKNSPIPVTEAATTKRSFVPYTSKWSFVWMDGRVSGWRSSWSGSAWRTDLRQQKLWNCCDTEQLGAYGLIQLLCACVCISKPATSGEEWTTTG